MKRADYRFNLADIPVIADHILDKYKRDRSYFEHYSPRFNLEFLVRFEERVNSLTHLTPLQVLENGIIQVKNKIEGVISSFGPLLNITETYLRCIPKAMMIRSIRFSLKDLKEALNRQCIWEIQRSCLKIAGQLEMHLEEFLDKGFLMILLNDFHLLIKRLNDAETELADITHQCNIITDEYRFVDNQLKDLVETIIESTSGVFGENDTGKMDEYSVENLMIQSQFKRTDSQ
jgi:hypothetical protein